MFKTFINAFKVKEIRTKLLFTFLMLIVIRFGSQLPIPGTNGDVISSVLSNFTGEGGFNFFSAFTGSTFEQMSLFALGISPYITSSIIMQLLTIAIPKLEELQKDGESGRKKIAEITRYVTVGLALIEGIAMSIGFGNQGLFGDAEGTKLVMTAIIAVAAMVAGSAALMWIGERITESGVGNGISIILLINILAGVPRDIIALFQSKVLAEGLSFGVRIVAAVIIIGVMVAIILLTILLQGGERRIAVQYAKKLQGRKMLGGMSTHIPLKVNVAGVIPVIFASSLMSFPGIIAGFFNYDTAKGAGKIIHNVITLLSSNSWFNISDGLNSFKWTLGFVIYAVLVVAFAYFYTAITFNPVEVANNMKKQGGAVPGIRPGKPTEEYLTKILNAMVFIGAIGLLIVATIPVVCSGLFSARVSFGGTSIIIVVGVILETLNKIESMMVTRNYKGFLNN